MKKIITIIFCIFLIFSCGQTQKNIKDFSNQKTDKHINIQGTRIFLIPPKNFKLSDNFQGLIKNQSTFIQVIEQQKLSYTVASKNFNKEGFEKRKQKVLNFQEFKMNDYNAKFIEIESNSEDNGYGILFGNDDYSVMIFGVYPKNDIETGNEIKTSILTVFYDKDFLIKKNMVFDTNVQNSSFKLYKIENNISIYTPDGETMTNDYQNPFITIFTVPISYDMSMEHVSENLLTTLKEKGFVIIDKKNEVKTNQYYEIEVYGKINGVKYLSYHFVKKNEHNAILIQGQTNKNFEKNIENFKQFSKSVKMN